MKQLFFIIVLFLLIGCDVFKLQEKINFDKDDVADVFNPVLGAESYSYIPAQTGVVIGPNGTDISHTVAGISGFYILKTEVTYKLWYAVNKWAEENEGYSIDSGGSEGTGSEGGVPTSGADLPVTNITWRDAIVWCNAYSEYCGLTPVYYTDSSFQAPMRTSSGTDSIDDDDGGADNPFLIKSGATGFRLPTEAEWEYAARRKTGGTMQSGDYPSGALINNNFSSYCWYGISALHNVASLLQNSMGLYDMSGNVAEFCWDWHGAYTTAPPYIDIDTWGPGNGSYRIVRGGSYLSVEEDVRASNRGSCNPWDANKSTGFRIVRGSAP